MRHPSPAARATRNNPAPTAAARWLARRAQSAMSAVRPCPCCSTAMICRVLAKDGRIFPNVVSIGDPSP